MVKKYKIKLPPNLTYDIKDLTLLHNNQTNHISLESSSLPQEILSNLLTKYTHNTIQDYITFLQLNLQSLLDGKETKNKEIFYDGPLNIKLIAVIKHFLLIELTKFTLLIKCIKCNKINKCKSNEEYLCTCKEIIQINYKSKLINNPMVGYLMIKKGSFINFIDLFYEGICFCDKKIKFINSFEEKCICKNVNVFKTESLEYLENKKKEKIECVHYKESCRMFVFPCCKNVYSCPKCHDKNERHKFEYAYQMICLVCNKKVSVKDVCDCGYVHIKKKSVFWEGGKGKRDKITMSKKDSKKYK